MEGRGLTVGPLQENCFLAKADGAETCIVVDPGDEAERILGEVEQLGGAVEAILLTHTHFDHVGAVAPLARMTGAPVWCPKLEVEVLKDINRYVLWPGIGPFENYDADHTIEGGEVLELAGLSIAVHFTPGHSPGHVTFVVPAENVMFSGDVLFQGSVGRTDLPGGDWPTLARSIQGLLDTFPDEATVFPGHMGVTTLGAERASNPFLAELV